MLRRSRPPAPAFNLEEEQAPHVPLSNFVTKSTLGQPGRSSDASPAH
jgi:hypothetical protein